MYAFMLHHYGHIQASTLLVIIFVTEKYIWIKLKEKEVHVKDVYVCP